MDRLIYTSLTAMRGSMSRQTAIANNLANAQTPGFRADIANAQSLWLDGSGLDARAMMSEEVLGADMRAGTVTQTRSEEHTSELQSLMRISYAVFSLKKK